MRFSPIPELTALDVIISDFCEHVVDANSTVIVTFGNLVGSLFFGAILFVLDLRLHERNRILTFFPQSEMFVHVSRSVLLNEWINCIFRLGHHLFRALRGLRSGIRHVRLRNLFSPTFNVDI